MSEEFEKAVAAVNNLKSKPSDDDLLELYGWFKQATVGDVNTDRPGLFDPKGKAKWDAWSCKKGASADAAKQSYVSKAKELGAL